MLTKQKPAPWLRRLLAGLLLRRPVFVSRSVSDLWWKNSTRIGPPTPTYVGPPCATSRRNACTIIDAVVGIFHWLNPSGRIMVLGSTQPLTDDGSYRQLCLADFDVLKWTTALVPAVLCSSKACSVPFHRFECAVWYTGNFTLWRYWKRELEIVVKFRNLQQVLPTVSGAKTTFFKVTVPKHVWKAANECNVVCVPATEG